MALCFLFPLSGRQVVDQGEMEEDAVVEGDPPHHMAQALAVLGGLVGEWGREVSVRVAMDLDPAG
jgi:hypothetical protein